jgi:hypothetical protein
MRSCLGTGTRPWTEWLTLEPSQPLDSLGRMIESAESGVGRTRFTPSDVGSASSSTDGESASLKGVSGSSTGDTAEANTTVTIAKRINVQ